jgi:osmotically-inducible protein OsmY
MKTNEELQKDVQDALKWEPLLHAAEIGVIVKEGIVTLTGTVDSYAKKLEAEHAAKSVAGVRAVVDEVVVHLGHGEVVSDEDIAADAVRMLRESLILPKDAITVIVEDGWLTLEGALHWNYQREAAKHLIKDLPGVRGVTNNIHLKKDLHKVVDKEEIIRAFKRNWAIDADYIEVIVNGSAVELKGYVYSIHQREEAEKLAYKCPGVEKVINNLKVDLGQPYLC